eukprot:CAMPEP_0178919644 /NCGR_PEP_ID=MMETSP0786-20121207/14556_1 /TAXON_ID=186022 /ORGANISM="Thalassionema frauenfeldii, Strain CCMP 1798" /LENGTH=334 /DNA_ID=CAMNT_0020593607 /DNA_START=68 /DNA_END=1069 /DNA_ORIENTATION=+
MKLTQLGFFSNFFAVLARAPVFCVEAFLSHSSVVTSRSQSFQHSLKGIDDGNDERPFILEEYVETESLNKAGAKVATLSPNGRNLNFEFEAMAENLEFLKKKEEQLTKMLDEAAEEIEVQSMFQSLKKRYHFQRSLLQTRLQRELKARQKSERTPKISDNNNSHIDSHQFHRRLLEERLRMEKKTSLEGATRTTGGEGELGLLGLSGIKAEPRHESERVMKNGASKISSDESYIFHRRLLEERLRMEKRTILQDASHTTGSEEKMELDGPSEIKAGLADESERIIKNNANKISNSKSHIRHRRFLEERLRMEKKTSLQDASHTTGSEEKMELDG